MWVYHYEPESKRQSMEWKHLGSPTKKKFKTQPSAGKVRLTVFWDSKGPILEDYLEKGRTINIETINHLGFEVLEHHAYSPDLAPSDYHLFGPLKNALRDR